MRHQQTTPSSQAAPRKAKRHIVVGIDPGLDKHGVVALVAGSCSRLAGREIPNTVAGMKFLANLLTQWQDQAGGQLTIGIEEASAFGEAVECFLCQAGFSVAVVSAFKVARFKEAVHIDANDRIDAEAVARLLMVQPDLARPPARQATERDPHGRSHRRLRQLSRRHQRWTKNHTATGNELHAVLRMAWLAEYQSFFSRISGAAALAFWQTYPTPAQAAQADPADIALLLQQASHGRLNKTIARKKADHIHATARLLVLHFGKKDPQRWSAWTDDIRLLAKHLSEQTVVLKQLEKQMKALLAEIDTPLTSFKGLGTVIAATIHGEMLSLDRFETADRFARYNGTAPREDSTGRSPRHVKNTRCNRRLKQAFLQLALLAAKYHPASADYLDQLRSRGLTGGPARIRLARRLSNIVYAMLKHNRPYDLNVHLEKNKHAA